MFPSQTSPKKPSPLSFGAQRSSPFKRPDSPLTRTPSTFQSSPSATKVPALASSQIPSLVLPDPPSPATSVASTIIPDRQEQDQDQPQYGSPSGPRQTAYSSSTFTYHQPRQLDGAAITHSPTSTRPAARPTMQRTTTGSDPVTKLHPAQLRDMRESFQVLDRDNDGQVNRDDVAEVLVQLGLDASAPSLTPYFPPSAAPSLGLPTYLNSLSSLLADLSRHDELSAAFAAFDVDDSGQIDVDELRDALMHTNASSGGKSLSGRELDSVFEEFSSRRTFGKGLGGKEAGRRGEVFRYAEFMDSMTGGSKAAGANGIPGADGVAT